MRVIKNHGVGVFEPTLLASALFIAVLPAAQAFEITTGSEDWAVRFDNTFMFN